MARNTERKQSERLGSDLDAALGDHVWWISMAEGGFLGHDGDSWCATTFVRLMALFPTEEAAREGWRGWLRQVHGEPGKPTFERAEGSPESLALRLLVSMAIRGEVSVVAAFKGVAEFVELAADWEEVLARDVNKPQAEAERTAVPTAAQKTAGERLAELQRKRAKPFQVGDHVEIAHRVLDVIGSLEEGCLGFRVGEGGGLRTWWPKPPCDDATIANDRASEDDEHDDDSEWSRTNIIAVAAGFSGSRVVNPDGDEAGFVRLTYADLGGIADTAVALALEWSPPRDSG